jgi:hypothetical protein
MVQTGSPSFAVINANQARQGTTVGAKPVMDLPAIVEQGKHVSIRLSMAHRQEKLAF